MLPDVCGYHPQTRDSGCSQGGVELRTCPKRHLPPSAVPGSWPCCAGTVPCRRALSLALCFPGPFLAAPQPVTLRCCSSFLAPLRGRELNRGCVALFKDVLLKPCLPDVQTEHLVSTFSLALG